VLGEPPLSLDVPASPGGFFQQFVATGMQEPIEPLTALITPLFSFSPASLTSKIDPPWNRPSEEPRRIFMSSGVGTGHCVLRQTIRMAMTPLTMWKDTRETHGSCADIGQGGFEIDCVLSLCCTCASPDMSANDLAPTVCRIRASDEF
jgi:hypothetical protein